MEDTNHLAKLSLEQLELALERFGLWKAEDLSGDMFQHVQNFMTKLREEIKKRNAH